MSKPIVELAEEYFPSLKLRARLDGNWSGYGCKKPRHARLHCEIPARRSVTGIIFVSAISNCRRLSTALSFANLTTSSDRIFGATVAEIENHLDSCRTLLLSGAC